MRAAIVGLLAAVAIVTWPSAVAIPRAQQTSQEISIDLTAASKTPRLALPAPIVAGGDAELADAAKTVMSTLWTDLNFEEEFDLVSRDAAARVPAADTIEALPIDRWADLGADYVVMAKVERAAAGFTVDLQLIAVRGATTRKPGFASVYGPCVITGARLCAHAISDDMHKKIRRLDGVAQTLLAFVSDRDSERLRARLGDTNQGKEIYISDYDGENQRRFTANQSLNLWPAWGPDGHTLAYVSYVTRNQDIFVRDLFDTRAAARPAAGTDRMMNNVPSFSPDGSKIAFASTRDGNWDIWVVNRDGSGLTNLTHNSNPNVINNCPTWAPSGALIAFTSDRTGTNQIWVMTTQGTGLEKLTSDLAVDRPTWSPGSFNEIAYTAGTLSGHDIYLLDVSTRQVRVLTAGLGDTGSPAFAPNGRHIAYVTNRWGKDQIAVLDRKGNFQLRITSSGANTYPSWSRTAKR